MRLTSGLTNTRKTTAPSSRTCSAITKRSSPVRRSERIPTSFDTCCSTLYAFFPAAIVPRSSLAAPDVEHRADLGRVRAVALGELPVGECVAPDRERLAAREPALDDGVVGARARHADREQHDRRVDDVAAVATPVSPHEAPEGPRDRLARERAPRGRPAHELDDDRGEDERRERVRDQPRDRRSRPEGDEQEPRVRARCPRATRPPARGRASDARRHATSGPIPISRRSGSPKIRRKKSKYGRPTTTDSPRTASETMGHAVPQRIVRQSATSRRLL